MNTSLHLLPPSGEIATLIGDRVPAAGWYGHTNGLHTVAIRVLNFTGRLTIQASIATNPTDGDWYSVLPDSVDYWEYPQIGYVIPPNNSGETSIMSFNFITNAVWVRASIDRTYFQSDFTPIQLMPYGTVSYVMVNY